ncbi:MAG: hypothetical protein MR292_02860 [Alistipes sp.]|nr:hypothetical protein [Alistipes sp.]
MKVGIVIVDEQLAFGHRNLAATTESLKTLGCANEDILVRHTPRVQNITIAAQFFAEYTDVDAVVVLVENDNTPEYAAMLYGITKLQISWNMPIVLGGCTAASEAAEIVTMQCDMEAAAPEPAADRKAIN